MYYPAKYNSPRPRNQQFQKEGWSAPIAKTKPQEDRMPCRMKCDAETWSQVIQLGTGEVGAVAFGRPGRRAMGR